jgi:Inner membrane component of T3SS, cytoplasmic domain
MSDDPIVITREEATSQHVDDLLRRQMNLRGEAAVAAEPRRRWYFQNWLLFSVVGAIAAFAGWLLIEPSFEDFFYIQGRIEELDTEESMTPETLQGVPADQLEMFGQGWVEVNGQRVWLSPMLRQAKDGRHSAAYDGAQLTAGMEIGLYTKYAAGARGDLAVAHYIDPTPAPGRKTKPLHQQSQASDAAGLMMFSAVAGMIGLALGAVDGIVTRQWHRALVGGLVGALIGIVGGLLSNVIANVIYIPVSGLAQQQLASESSTGRAFGFMLQMIARMFGWTLAGCAMGLGQGVALRSKRILAHGFLGGVIGGMLGGLVFDPLDFVILGADKIGADSSRLIGIVVIGIAVGAMIGVVELLTRDAWLRMVEGPLAGKEFLIFRDTMNIGASPRSEIYLFNDDQVAPTHATLRVIGDETEIAARDKVHPLLINGQNVRASRLRHGDRIQIGQTSFVFEQRQR